MLKKLIKSSLFVFFCSLSCNLFAETNPPLSAEKQTVLAQRIQDLERMGITPEQIIEHCSTTYDHWTTKSLSLEKQGFLFGRLQELEIQNISTEHIIQYCSQRQADEDAARFYQNLVWVGVGSFILTGVAILAYIAWNKKPEDPVEAERERRHRKEMGNFTGEDRGKGMANIDRIVNDPNEDLALRRIIAEAYLGSPFNLGLNPLANNELRDVPLEVFLRADALIQDNIYGLSEQATHNYIVELIERRQAL